MQEVSCSTPLGLVLAPCFHLAVTINSLTIVLSKFISYFLLSTLITFLVDRSYLLSSHFYFHPRIAISGESFTYFF